MRSSIQETIKNDNEKLLLEEIRAKKTVLTALPPRLTFEVSRACNYVCKKCVYAATANPPGFSAVRAPEWEKEDIERVVEELFPTLQYTESTLLGEPLLNRNFAWFMGLYKKHGVYFRPTTNASLLTLEKLEVLDGTLDWLKCSFDAHTRELYHKLYLKDSFKAVSENLTAFGKYRWKMSPVPWFRVGLVLMRSNMPYLTEYADYCNEVLGVDDIEIMALNNATPALADEFYWNIPDVVDKAVDKLINHCIKKRYRLRLPFVKMGTTRIYEDTDDAANCNHDAEYQSARQFVQGYSRQVKQGDIFGNKEQLERTYIWSNHERVATVFADDLSLIKVCEYFTRPFLKPPEVPGGPLWVEACGSCSTFRFGDLKKQAFKEIYNNELNQALREYMYRSWGSRKPLACERCLCIDSVYNETNNGAGNVGRRWGVGEDIYV